MVDFIGCEVSSGMRTPEPDGVVADGPPVLPERDTHRTRQVAPPPADDHPADGDLHPADGPEIMSDGDTLHPARRRCLCLRHEQHRELEGSQHAGGRRPRPARNVTTRSAATGLLLRRLGEQGFF
jgi:hypothetical protein